MDWRVLELLHVIDDGAYGVIIAVRHRKTGVAYAVKAGKHASADPSVLYQTLREIRVLSGLPKHPNIVRLADAFRSEGEHIYLVFELAHGGLHKELERLPGFRLPGPQLKLVAWQLLRALAHCHEHGVIHRDVKPANVLVCGPIAPPPGTNADGAAAASSASVTAVSPASLASGTGLERGTSSHTTVGGQSSLGAVRATGVPLIKLCDFGFARKIKCSEPWYGHRLSSYVVTRYYRAPEVLVGAKYGTAVDIWSYGCTLAELAMGRPLFPGETSLDQLGLIMRCMGRLPPQQSSALMADLRAVGLEASVLPSHDRTLPDLLPDVEPQLLDLISACLALDPARRPTAAQLLRMPYFAAVPSMLIGTDLEYLLRSTSSPSSSAASSGRAVASSCGNASSSGSGSAADPTQLPYSPTMRSSFSVNSCARATAPHAGTHTSRASHTAKYAEPAPCSSYAVAARRTSEGLPGPSSVHRPRTASSISVDTLPTTTSITTSTTTTSTSTFSTGRYSCAPTGASTTSRIRASVRDSNISSAAASDVSFSTHEAHHPFMVQAPPPATVAAYYPAASISVVLSPVGNTSGSSDATSSSGDAPVRWKMANREMGDSTAPRMISSTTVISGLGERSVNGTDRESSCTSAGTVAIMSAPVPIAASVSVSSINAIGAATPPIIAPSIDNLSTAGPSASSTSSASSGFPSSTPTMTPSAVRTTTIAHADAHRPAHHASSTIPAPTVVTARTSTGVLPRAQQTAVPDQSSVRKGRLDAVLNRANTAAVVTGPASVVAGVVASAVAPGCGTDRPLQVSSDNSPIVSSGAAPSRPAESRKKALADFSHLPLQPPPSSLRSATIHDAASVPPPSAPPPALRTRSPQGPTRRATWTVAQCKARAGTHPTFPPNPCGGSRAVAGADISMGAQTGSGIRTNMGSNNRGNTWRPRFLTSRTGTLYRHHSSVISSVAAASTASSESLGLDIRRRHSATRDGAGNYLNDMPAAAAPYGVQTVAGTGSFESSATSECCSLRWSHVLVSDDRVGSTVGSTRPYTAMSSVLLTAGEGGGTSGAGDTRPRGSDTSASDASGTVNTSGRPWHDRSGRWSLTAPGPGGGVGVCGANNNTSTIGEEAGTSETTESSANSITSVSAIATAVVERSEAVIEPTVTQPIDYSPYDQPIECEYHIDAAPGPPLHTATRDCATAPTSVFERQSCGASFQISPTALVSPATASPATLRRRLRQPRLSLLSTFFSCLLPGASQSNAASGLACRDDLSPPSPLPQMARSASSLPPLCRPISSALSAAAPTAVATTGVLTNSTSAATGGSIVDERPRLPLPVPGCPVPPTCSTEEVAGPNPTQPTGATRMAVCE